MAEHRPLVEATKASVVAVVVARQSEHGRDPGGIVVAVGSNVVMEVCSECVQACEESRDPCGAADSACSKAVSYGEEVSCGEEESSYSKIVACVVAWAAYAKNEVDK
jgi:hypothetical protein